MSIYLALGLIFFAWHYSLKCGYISDDHAVIPQRKDIIPDTEKNPQKQAYWVKVFNDGIVMYYLNNLMFKLKLKHIPFAWHLLCVGIHLANSYLLYIFLKPIVGESVAVGGVFLWAINPMLNQNVGWISGRPYSIAVLLCLAGMVFYKLPFVFFPLYMLGVITNISIALLPILMRMFYPCWQTNLYLILMIVGGFPFVLWKFKHRFQEALVIDRDNFRFKKRRMNAIVRTYAYYVWTLFCPIRMGWYHQAGFRYNSRWELFNVYTLLGYIIVFVFMKLGVFGWWFLLGILPNINVFVVNSFLEDRYLYFGSIGLWVLVGMVLVKYPELFIIVSTFYIVRSYMYSRHLLSDETMYRENWRNHPKSDYAVNNLSFFLIQQKRFEEARVVILRGLEIDKTNKMLWYNLGVTWAATGELNSQEGKFRFLRAIDCWKMALQVEPRWAKPAEDMKALTQFLIDHKVITLNKDEAAPGGMVIDIPVEVQSVKA